MHIYTLKQTHSLLPEQKCLLVLATKISLNIILYLVNQSWNNQSGRNKGLPNTITSKGLNE